MMQEFYVGVKGIVRVDDAVLVLRKVEPAKSFWDVPGGRIDGDESIEETLARELAEEVPSLGTYRTGNLLHAFRIPGNPNGKGLLLMFYLIEAEPFEVSLSPEHVESRWITADTLEELQNTPGVTLDPGTHRALQKALS